MAVKKSISAKKEKDFANAMMAAMARDNRGNISAGRKRKAGKAKK